MAGYDNEMFVDPPDQSGGLFTLLCPVCIMVLREPHLMSCCGKHLCKVYLAGIEAFNKPCPCCNETQFSKMFDKGKNGIILGLKAYCSNRGRGCNWTGELGDVDRHIQTRCEYTTAECPNGCGQRVSCHSIPKHTERECSKRPIEVQLKCLSIDMEEKLRAIEFKHEEKVTELEKSNIALQVKVKELEKNNTALLATVKKQEKRFDEQTKELKKNEQGLTTKLKKIEEQLKQIRSDQLPQEVTIPLSLGKVHYIDPRANDPFPDPYNNNHIIVTKCLEGSNPGIKLRTVTPHEKLLKAEARISEDASRITTEIFWFPPEKKEAFRYLFGDHEKCGELLIKSSYAMMINGARIFLIPNKKPITIEVCGYRDCVKKSIEELEGFRDNRPVEITVALQHYPSKHIHEIKDFATSKSVTIDCSNMSNRSCYLEGGKYDCQLVNDYIEKMITRHYH